MPRSTLLVAAVTLLLLCLFAAPARSHFATHVSEELQEIDTATRATHWSTTVSGDPSDDNNDQDDDAAGDAGPKFGKNRIVASSSVDVGSRCQWAAQSIAFGPLVATKSSAVKSSTLTFNFTIKTSTPTASASIAKILLADSADSSSKRLEIRISNVNAGSCATTMVARNLNPDSTATIGSSNTLRQPCFANTAETSFTITSTYTASGSFTLALTTGANAASLLSVTSGSKVPLGLSRWVNSFPNAGGKVLRVGFDADFKKTPENQVQTMAFSYYTSDSV